MNKLVSIIVPTYNVEPYLKQCLDSIINQTLKDIEIICVDDGSTDNSGAILDEYAKKDSRIKVIHKENGGYGKAMNVGLDNAAGEYIGIVEPDDYIELNMYEDLYKIAKEKDLDFVKADFYRFTSEEKIYNQLDETGTYYNQVIKPCDVIESFNFIMNTWSGIYKREFIEKYSIRHNETPGASFQDNGFWFQTFALAERGYFVNKPYYMNRRDNPNSSVKNKEKVFCMKVEYDYIKEFLNKHPDLKAKLIGIYQYRKFHNYIGTFNRVDIKFKKLFLETFTAEYQEAYKNNEIDESLFNDYELEKLRLITTRPDKFYKKALNKVNLLEMIFSVTNYLSSNNKWYKVIRILGFRISIRYREKEARLQRGVNK